MNFLQNRYGISAISKKYKINAVPQEIMIDKDTGEIQVVSKEGNIFSYDSISRLNAHIDTLKFNAYNGDVYGSIYNVNIENLDLPSNVEKDTELLDGDLNISTGEFKRFMLSIDLDVLNPNRKLSNIDISEVPMQLSFSYENGGTTQSMIIVEPINRLNRMILSSDDFPANITNIRLTSLKILESEIFDGHEKFILHSILLNVE